MERTCALMAPRETLLHFFADGCATFNPTRWETHVVDLLVGTLIEALLEGPKSVPELLSIALDASDLPVPQAERFVEEALAQLSGLDLVTVSSNDEVR